MNKKKEIILVVVMLLLPVGFYIYFNLNQVTLKSDVLASEYGDEISFRNEEILDTTDSKILESSNIDQSKINYEPSKDYPEIGNHELVITYKEFFRTHAKNLILVVSDTKDPIFVEAPEIVEISTNASVRDFKGYFAVEDLSDFELLINTDSIDFEKPETYDAVAIAKDIYGNKATHEFKIIIKAEKEPIEKEEVLEESSESEDTSKLVLEIPEENKSIETEKVEQVDPTIKNGILIVNKKHPLPENYNPGENPKAIAQLNRIIREMQRLGFDVSDDYSGFRTYDYQKNLYDRYVNNDGIEAADTYSARAGYSEHQTGLAFDLKHFDGTLVIKEAEAQWISENAVDYGFIIRYQVGKENITGYKAEPWHLRYIGDEAKNVYHSGLTLEEYLGIDGGDYLDE